MKHLSLRKSKRMLEYTEMVAAEVVIVLRRVPPGVMEGRMDNGENVEPGL